MVFSIQNRDSFKSLQDQYIPRTRLRYPRASIVLVGTHLDGIDRTLANPSHVAIPEALELCGQYRSIKGYYEVDCAMRDGIWPVIVGAMRVARLNRSWGFGDGNVTDPAQVR